MPRRRESIVRKINYFIIFYFSCYSFLEAGIRDLHVDSADETGGATRRHGLHGAWRRMEWSYPDAKYRAESGFHG